MLTVTIAFRHGCSVDDINDRLRSNPRFGFVSRNAARARAKKAAYQCKHRSLTLKKDDGFSWAEMSDKRKRLLGTFVYWLCENARDVVG